MSEHDEHHDHHELGTPPTPEEAAFLATPEYRLDGPDKVTGAALYAGDMQKPGMLWAAFLGSPVPYGRIRSVDTSRAKAMPGVHAILTGEDVKGILFARRLMDRPVICWDVVRFVGDRVAAVAAETLEQAQAAVEAIELDIEELTPILNPEDAFKPDAPVLHPDYESYGYLGGTRPPVPHPNQQGKLFKKRGEEDIEAVFARAHRVFEHTFSTPRHHAGFIEPHAAMAWLDESGLMHVISTNKTPLNLRQQMAKAMGVKPAELVIEANTIGGDFGGKGYSIDEYALVYLARATGRPVKAVTRYADELAAYNVRHASVSRLRTAVDEDGRIIAHEARVIMDGGAYANAKPLPALAPAGGTAVMAAYKVPNVKISVQVAYTNTVPAGHVRSPGEVQAIFAGESHLDMIARELGMDPLEFRLRNVVRDGERGSLGDNFRENPGEQLLKAAAEAIGWDKPRKPNHGVGIAIGVRHVGGGAMSLGVKVHADGRLEIISGLVDVGGGQSTMLRRVFSLVSGIDESRIFVTKRTTADQPQDQGVGGSRVTNIGGRTAEALATAVREWYQERLPRVLPNGPEHAELRDDSLVDPETGARLVDYGALAQALVSPEEPVELSATHDAGTHGPEDPGDNNFCCYAIEVKVDPETGSIELVDAVLAADVGTIINPVAHRGQLEGGFGFGVGAALMEEVQVEDGVVVGQSMAEFKLPAMRDVPTLRQVLVPTAVGPGAFGAKMAGELSNSPAAPAIANAVADAVGARVTDLPLTPERVLQALRARA